MPDATDLPTSLWQVKPWWCQPWSIVLTGVTIPLGSWLWLGWWWLTAGLTLLVLGWWFMFLYLVPRQFKAAVAQATQSEMTQSEATRLTGS